MTDLAEYCREVEAYLCRKNEGHLIRIAGPVFEQVSGWAAQGVPLAVVCRGIDRYCERYYAKGSWRRAVGVAQLVDAGAGTDATARRDSLPAHLDRAIARLTAMRAGGRSAALDRRLDEAVRELDRTRAAAKQARGDGRAIILERLAVL